MQRIVGFILLLTVSHQGVWAEPDNDHNNDQNDLSSFFPQTIPSSYDDVAEIYARADAEALLARHKPSIFLIIDDLGDNYSLAKRLIDLPVKLNLSVLPNTPFAGRLAELGHQKGHDIMLHLPMEAKSRNDLLGKGALFSQLDERDTLAIFRQNLQQIPFVKGFNNHMGSVLTQSHKHMNWLMKSAAEQQLYFVDSRTIAGSVAHQVAQQKGVQTLSRDIFLDPVADSVSVHQQLSHALSIADRRGHVVIIGHPQADTVEVLEQQLPEIARHYQLRTISGFWRETTSTKPDKIKDITAGLAE
ncbi:MAG: divergent polysaccharide deacetylase family protein [Kangiellaceae bacterium]|jgi:polysaccharide deacetylase 2 family uncharacterized protein YibQ|nr:divergent polysaccharide deacetylase family protein [Kangiellaceae bacterium]